MPPLSTVRHIVIKKEVSKVEQVLVQFSIYFFVKIGWIKNIFLPITYLLKKYTKYQIYLRLLTFKFQDFFHKCQKITILGAG